MLAVSAVAAAPIDVAVVVALGDVAHGVVVPPHVVVVAVVAACGAVAVA